MSPFTSNQRGLQHRSQVEANIRKRKSTAGYALLLSSVSVALIGCQSSSHLSSTAGTPQPLIDFDTADGAQSQAQGRAFHARLNANSDQYQQLFDSTTYPDNDMQAKQRLLAAIRQHLATEHVAVAHASYHAVPFIKADSIDAGSSGLLRTLINLYAYKNADSADDDNNDYDVDSDAEAVVASVAADDSTDAELIENNDDVFDEDGFNQAGYDESGYDQYGYDKDGYNEYGNQKEEEYNGGRGGLLSGIRGLNPKELLNDYEAMHTKQQQAANQKEATAESDSSGAVSQILSMFSRTPEQIEAMNTYQYQYLSINSVTQYQPQNKRIQSVYSYDYLAPTITSSIQLPIALDFNNSRVIIDPSALMPIMAIASPEDTPLPTQMAAHTVGFGLPETITSQIPVAVIYDAAINAVQNSMAELAPDYFSAVDISGDKFAKEVGATQAVKVYFGSRQSGELIGKVFKYVSRSLQDYVDANPEKYPEDAALKTAITKIAHYNKGYQSADVGSLLQLIEAIGPISFNHTNYYYLDHSDRLLAKQQRVNVGGDLLGSKTTVINQTRYDNASFNKHPLAPLLAQSFGANAPPAIDGNALIRKIQQQTQRLQQAREARYEYDEKYNLNENYDDSYNNNSNDTLDIEDE
ncbi:hypothetical protein [Psychrobacter urativorans]|uniref:Uncharacterized protein n=1 Tax=Psychrobacter urativorans TaxID=45610 RepID=A0A0M3V896_9GAMM|nr:hypothetical protein [Psychrobacter urativorans]ALF58783.1 hypothetical protein AOC03_00890 [Psychrobacter urativorans]